MKTLTRTLPLVVILAAPLAAFPALAQDAFLTPATTATAPAATATTATAPVEAMGQPVCIDGMCLEVVSAPILELDATEGEVSWLDDAPQLWRPQYATSDTPMGFTSGSANDGGATVIGEISAERDSAADDWLGTESSGMLSNNGDVDTVDGVTGLGFVSKF